MNLYRKLVQLLGATVTLVAEPKPATLQPTRSAVRFQARVWLEPDSHVFECWVHELETLQPAQLSGAEWVGEFCSGAYDREDWARLLELDPAKCWQAVFTGELRGSFDYWGEYDEELEIEEVQAVEVPASFYAPPQELIIDPDTPVS